MEKAQNNEEHAPNKDFEQYINIFTTGKKDMKPQNKITNPSKKTVGTPSQSEPKLLESKFTSGSAAYGSVKICKNRLILNQEKCLYFWRVKMPIRNIKKS